MLDPTGLYPTLDPNGPYYTPWTLEYLIGPHKIRPIRTSANQDLVFLLTTSKLSGNRQLLEETDNWISKKRLDYSPSRQNLNIWNQPQFHNNSQKASSKFHQHKNNKLKSSGYK